ASKSINPAGADGLIHGNAGQLLTQGIGVAAAWLVAGAGTFLILKLVSLFVPLRVTSEEELTGLDLAVHGEEAYNLLPPGMTSSVMPQRLGAQFLAKAEDDPEGAGSERARVS